MIWTAALFSLGFQLIRIIPTLAVYLVNPDISEMMLAALSGIGVAGMLYAILHVRGVAGDVLEPGDTNAAIGIAVLGVLAVAYALSTAATLLLVHTAGPSGASVDHGFVTLMQTSGRLETYLAVALVGPVVEEFVYRGMLMGVLLARGWRPVPVILLSSLVFTVQHFQYGWIGLVSVFIYGAAFGILRVGGGGLAAPIAAHVLFNLLSVAALG
ncbi:MAG: type II CAAX endopeptidase family protein [Hyphomonas sp.]